MIAQQYGCLNKTTLSTDMLIWKGEFPQGPPLDKELQEMNDF